MAKKAGGAAKAARVGNKPKVYDPAKFLALDKKMRGISAELRAVAKAMEKLKVREIEVHDAMVARSVAHLENFLNQAERRIRDIRRSRGAIVDD